MRRHHRLALAACLAAACLLFLPAAPAACAQGVEEAEPYKKAARRGCTTAWTGRPRTCCPKQGWKRAKSGQTWA